MSRRRRRRARALARARARATLDDSRREMAAAARTRAHCAARLASRSPRAMRDARARPGVARAPRVVPARRAPAPARRRRHRRRARVDVDAPPPTPPPGYDAFAVERVIALTLRDAGRGRSASARAWLADPANFVELVFGATDAREREGRGKRGGRAYDVAVRPRALFGWEIAPAFAIEAIEADAAGRVDARARLVGDELRFAGDARKLPPGFATMGVWAHIDARVGIDESRSTATETVVETEVRVKIAAEVPRLLRAIPGFSKAATTTIGRSIDIVGGGIDDAAQRTYDRWAAQRGTASAED